MKKRKCELCGDYFKPRNKSQRRCCKNHYIICPKCGRQHELKPGVSILPKSVKREVLVNSDEKAVIRFDKNDLNNCSKNLYHSRYGLLCGDCSKVVCIICGDKFQPKNQSECVCNNKKHYFQCPECGKLSLVRNMSDLPLHQPNSRKNVHKDTNFIIISKNKEKTIFTYDSSKFNEDTYLTSLCQSCKKSKEVQEQWREMHTKNLKEGRKKVTFGETNCVICGERFIRKNSNDAICHKKHYYVCPNCGKATLVQKTSWFNYKRDSVIYLPIKIGKDIVYFDYIYDTDNYDYIDSVCLECRKNDPEIKARCNKVYNKRAQETCFKNTGYKCYLESEERKKQALKTRKANRAAKTEEEIAIIKREQREKTMATNLAKYGDAFFPNVPVQNKGFIRLKLILPSGQEAYVSSFWEAVTILYLIYIKKLKNFLYEGMTLEYMYKDHTFLYIPDFIVEKTIYEVKGWDLVTQKKQKLNNKQQKKMVINLF